MFKVICPDCKQERTVKAKKKWMEGFEPFKKLCKSCCMIGKTHSEETKQKLSEIVKAAQTDERKEATSKFRKEHPETWVPNLIPGAGGGWNKGMELEPRSEETKEKISEGVRNAKSKKEKK